MYCTRTGNISPTSNLISSNQRNSIEPCIIQGYFECRVCAFVCVSVSKMPPLNSLLLRGGGGGGGGGGDSLSVSREREGEEF